MWSWIMRHLSIVSIQRRHEQYVDSMVYDHEKESLRQQLEETEQRLSLIEAQATLIRHEATLKEDGK
jgi:hypothetical protein